LVRRLLALGAEVVGYDIKQGSDRDVSTCWLPHRFKVVESDIAPETYVAGLLWTAVETGEREPIGAHCVWRSPIICCASKAATVRQWHQSFAQTPKLMNIDHPSKKTGVAQARAGRVDAARLRQSPDRLGKGGCCG
jgi:hypothetical protein